MLLSGLPCFEDAYYQANIFCPLVKIEDSVSSSLRYGSQVEVGSKYPKETSRCCDAGLSRVRTAPVASGGGGVEDDVEPFRTVGAAPAANSAGGRG